MPNHKSTLHLKILLSLPLLLLGIGQLSAFDAEYYSTTSQLSQGDWAKIEVSETGMQFISDATLKNLGYNDPTKVNVYGYGGVMIPETLVSPDDLPMVPSLRVSGGIIFFGKANVGWNVSKGPGRYQHISHPYSDNSYYFISDKDSEKYEQGTYVQPDTWSETLTDFTERLVHEEDLSMAMNTGRLMLGEDFKTKTSQTFNFDLPGNIGNVLVTTSFGCKTTSGQSTLSFTANGKQLLATSTDQMTASDTKLIVTTLTSKMVENPGTNMALTVKFNGSGSVTSAALDYIEVEYPRTLSITGGELYFYLDPYENSQVKIAGANSNTMVWNVTDPENPQIVETEVKGSELTFAVSTGYQEFVAFDPSMVRRGVTPGSKVANQDIHSMEAPGMVIISPSEYLPAAQRLVDLHKQTDGLNVLVLTPEEVYNEFSSGKPDVSAYRKMLKMWYDRAGGTEGKYTSYCLIMSRPTYDNKMVSAVVRNAGYPRVPIWQSPTGETETTSYSTDDYIGMLDDVPGTFNIGNAQIHVAVGRMPVRSLNEAHTVIDKLEEYLLNPDMGAWRNNIMIIADDQDNGTHLDQAEKVVSALKSEDTGNAYIYEKLYLDSYPLEYTGVGASYPQAHERMMNKWNEGLAFIDYIGHANAKSWGHEHLFTWTEINSMSNKRLPYLYAATCNFMRWDDDEISAAEILWQLPSSGVIGMICPSREVLITANGVLNEATARYVFMKDSEGNPMRCGDIMRLGKNSSNTGANKLRYGLIGDPAMRMPWPNNAVVVDEINGVDLSSSADWPVISARSTVTVSGHLEDSDGNLLSDFNGITEISLYDAEKVITTNGNGSNGVESVYNDRKTRLFTGRTKVVNGEWNVTFTMPSEIDNNYQPALLSLYAYEEQGREANGYSGKLYVYGYDENVPDDYEGPKIIEFYLDAPTFMNGGQVSPNPTLYAKFYDESGISVSEAGIGHNITLELDGKQFFDDVAQYYLPDENDTGAGSITYNLNDLPQGSHTLKFTVWDNANNSSVATLDFSISALWKPTIETLTTDVNPATASVNFIVATDGATSSMGCTIEVYDLWGKKVWRGDAPALSKSSTRTTLGWNLCDFGGGRVPGGIYLYRATVKTESGATVTKTRKLVVAPQ